MKHLGIFLERKQRWIDELSMPEAMAAARAGVGIGIGGLDTAHPRDCSNAL